MEDIWNQRFAAADYYYGKTPNPYFKERIDTLPPGWLLLPAEGEGRNGVYAASLGWKVKAVDFSDEGRNKALRLAAEKQVGLHYDLGDISTFDFEEELYDAVAMIYAHLPPAIRSEVHKRLIESLKPGGYFILEAFNKKQLGNTSGGPKSEEMLFSIELLQSDFKSLKILELQEYSVFLEAGDGHSGHADIIRFFGQK